MFEEVFNLAQPFGYFEAFSTIFVVCAVALVSFFILHYFRPKQ